MNETWWQRWRAPLFFLAIIALWGALMVLAVVHDRTNELRDAACASLGGTPTHGVCYMDGSRVSP